MIRDLGKQDLGQVVDLLNVMHGESWLTKYDLNLGRASYILCALIEDPRSFTMGYIKDDTVVGILIGEVVQHLFLDLYTAEDHFFYIHPDHRGGMAAVRLINQFQIYAASRNANKVAIQVTAGINNERTGAFLERLGYSGVGQCMAKGV
jgi:GNAT superfamily N-acetyltransferase